MKLVEYYESRKKMVDEAVQRFLEAEGLLDLTSTPLGGKRLRGVLTILVCEALGGRPEHAMDAAVAVELAHAASLDADDIVDMDVLRRGKPATWVLKGIVRTAVGTHALVAASFKLVERYGVDAVKVFIDTYARMVRGELDDIIKGSAYEAIIAAKTASLWSAAAALGAIAANRRDYLPVARDYGLATGMAFQIADDIVDTVKLVENLELGRLLKPSVAAFIAYIGIETVLRNPMAIIVWGVAKAKEDMKRAAMRKLEEWVNKAREHASRFPQSPFKQLLTEYPSLAIDMMFREAGA